MPYYYHTDLFRGTSSVTIITKTGFLSSSVGIGDQSHSICVPKHSLQNYLENVLISSDTVKCIELLEQ